MRVRKAFQSLRNLDDVFGTGGMVFTISTLDKSAEISLSIFFVRPEDLDRFRSDLDCRISLEGFFRFEVTSLISILFNGLRDRQWTGLVIANISSGLLQEVDTAVIWRPGLALLVLGVRAPFSFSCV